MKQLKNMYTQHYDLIVVGLGIMGIMAALQAYQRKEELAVLLLDRSTPMDGATRYCLGLDLPFGRTLEKKTQTRASYARWKFLRATSSILSPFLISDHPLITLGSDTNAIEAAATIELERIKLIATDIQQLKGQVVYGCNTSVYDVPRLTDHLLTHVQKYFFPDILFGNTIERITPIQDGWQLDSSWGLSFRGKYVVAALGPWLNSSCFIHYLEQKPLVKKIVCFELHGGISENTPVYYFFDEDAFIAPVHNKLFLSITSNDWKASVEKLPLNATRQEYQDGLKILKRYAVAKKIAGAHVFCDSYYPDFTPRVTYHGAQNSLAIISGASGSGFRLAPALADAALRFI